MFHLLSWIVFLFAIKSHLLATGFTASKPSANPRCHCLGWCCMGNLPSEGTHTECGSWPEPQTGSSAEKSWLFLVGLKHIIWMMIIHHILLWVHFFPFKRTNWLESWKIKSADNHPRERNLSENHQQDWWMKMIFLDLDQEMRKFVHFFDEIPESSLLPTKMPPKRSWANFAKQSSPPNGGDWIRESPKSPKDSGLGVISPANRRQTARNS